MGRNVNGVLWAVLSVVVVVVEVSVVVVEDGGNVTLENTYVGLAVVVEEPAFMISIIEDDKLGLYVVAVLLLSGVEEDVMGK